MKRPRTAMPKRPRTASSLVARSRKEAAIHLVRLEFDMNRLEMGIAQAAQRQAQYRAELDCRAHQRAALMKILNP